MSSLVLATEKLGFGVPEVFIIPRPLEEFGSLVLLADRFSKFCDIEIAISVFHGSGDIDVDWMGDIAEFDIVGEFFATPFHHGVFTNQFPRGLCVKAGDAFDVSIGNDDIRPGSWHAEDLLVTQLPARAPAAVLEIVEHRLDHIELHLGRDEGVKRMRGAEGVPSRKHAVVVVPVGRVDLAIESAVLVVHIAGQLRVEHDVIQGRVKIDLLVACAAFGIDHRQAPVPIVERRLAHAVKVPAGQFLLHVEFGIFRADIGNADLHQQFFALGGGKRGEPALLSFILEINRLAELQVKPSRMLPPSRRVHAAAECRFAFAPDGPADFSLARVEYALTQINKDAGRV